MNDQLDYDVQGMDLTEDSESERFAAYPDPGTGAEPWTCGYGHTGPDVLQSTTSTHDQNVAWLQQDMQHAQRQVKSLVSVALTQGEYDALVDFCFNCGEGNLARSTLLRLVNESNWMAASQEFAKWVNGGGHKLPGLVVRRHSESKLFLQRVDV